MMCCRVPRQDHLLPEPQFSSTSVAAHLSALSLCWSWELLRAPSLERRWHETKESPGGGKVVAPVVQDQEQSCSSNIHPPSAGWESCFAAREVECMSVSSQGCLFPLLCSSLMVGDTATPCPCGWDKLCLCCPRYIVVMVCRELHSTLTSKIQKIQLRFAANSSRVRDTAGNEGCTSWCFCTSESLVAVLGREEQREGPVLQLQRCHLLPAPPTHPSDPSLCAVRCDQPELPPSPWGQCCHVWEHQGDVTMAPWRYLSSEMPQVPGPHRPAPGPSGGKCRLS